MWSLSRAQFEMQDVIGMGCYCYWFELIKVKRKKIDKSVFQHLLFKARQTKGT